MALDRMAHDEWDGPNMATRSLVRVATCIDHRYHPRGYQDSILVIMHPLAIPVLYWYIFHFSNFSQGDIVSSKVSPEYF